MKQGFKTMAFEGVLNRLMMFNIFKKGRND
jgi:hypothetical protein